MVVAHAACDMRGVRRPLCETAALGRNGGTGPKRRDSVTFAQWPLTRTVDLPALRRQLRKHVALEPSNLNRSVGEALRRAARKVAKAELSCIRI